MNSLSNYAFLFLSAILEYENVRCWAWKLWRRMKADYDAFLNLTETHIIFCPLLKKIQNPTHTNTPSRKKTQNTKPQKKPPTNPPRKKKKRKPTLLTSHLIEQNSSHKEAFYMPSVSDSLFHALNSYIHRKWWQLQLYFNTVLSSLLLPQTDLWYQFKLWTCFHLQTVEKHSSK